MAGILDYLDWRGDLSFRTAPYNEVDELILCRLAYIPFEDVLTEEFSVRAMTLQEAVRRVRPLTGEHGDGRRLLMPGDAPMLEKLEHCRRFAAIRLTGYVNHLEPQKEKQFSATTMLLPDGSVLVAYRGTDGTMTGWKEDFNMSFADTVPAQLEAVEYLRRAGEHFWWARLRVCGHSKGGNLAVYAAAFCPPALQKRIVSVRNNDGPGFSDRVLKSSQYRSIVSRIHTYLPQSSIFGMLLEHAEAYSVVYSTNTGLAQHDLFSWSVTREHLVYVERLTEQSQFVDAALKDWMAAMTPAQREQVVDAVFDILHQADVTSMKELTSGKKNMVILKAVLRQHDPTRHLIFDALRILRHSVQNTLPRMRERSAADGTPPEAREGLPAAHAARPEAVRPAPAPKAEK